MEKTFLLYLSEHWGDLIEQINKKICHMHFKVPAHNFMKSRSRDGLAATGLLNWVAHY